MKVPSNIPLHEREWCSLSPVGRKAILDLVADAEAQVVAEPIVPCLADAISVASDEEIEALPYIGKSHVDKLRAWAKEQ